MPEQPLPGVDYVAGDLGDPDYADALIAGVQTVFHVAAATSGSTADFQRGTVVAAENVVNACERHGVRRMVYVSSLSVLEHAVRQRGAVTEDSRLEPRAGLRGDYTQSKLGAEKFVLAAASKRGLPAFILRPGAIFGPGAKAFNPPGSFALFGRCVVVRNGSLPLPLVYVDDVVDALLLGASRPGLEGVLVNLTDPAAITQREFCRMAANAGMSRRTVYIPKLVMIAAAAVIEWIGKLLGRKVPLTRYRVRSIRSLANIDPTAARERLGWTPKVGLSEGLRRTFPPSPPAEDN